VSTEPPSGALSRLTAAAILIAAVSLWAPAIAAAQDKDLTAIPATPKTYQPNKTSWGEPDLRGTWPIDHLNFTPLQRTAEQGNRVFLTEAEYAARAKQLGDRAKQFADEEKNGKLGMGHWVEVGTPNRRTSLLIDPANGRLPDQTEEGKRRGALMRSSYHAGQSFDWVTDFDSWDRCITRGMPASMFPFNYNNGIRIFQSPGVVAIQLEMVHETRIIPTDGKAALPGQMKNWLGESRGHWEGGNTLVIETDHLKTGPSATHAGTWGSPRNNDTPISDQARIVERITMTGPDTAVYEVTYSDPVVFTAPWTARFDWRRNEKYVLYEYACHEADTQIHGLITASRAARAQAAAKLAAAQPQAPQTKP
jgi:hypothetical protein